MSIEHTKEKALQIGRKIMNMKEPDQSHRPVTHRAVYKEGFRDARHDASVLAESVGLDCVELCAQLAKAEGLLKEYQKKTLSMSKVSEDVDAYFGGKK